MLVVSLLGRNWFNPVLREFPLAWARRGRRTCTIVCFVQFTNSCLRVCYHQVMLFRLYVSSLFRCKVKPFLAIAQLFPPFFICRCKKIKVGGYLDCHFGYFPRN